jgi:hypothetical protein
MRKRITGQAPTPQAGGSDVIWLDLESIAQVEVTSEDPAFPIENALTLREAHGGWRAAGSGEQLVRILFDLPRAVHRIKLHFLEDQLERTQEFALRWAAKLSEPLQQIVRQQWTFSPSGSTSEIENYQVNLTEVAVLELAIKADISSGAARASLAALRVA